MSFIVSILLDGFFAAVAAMGFSAISNPPKKIILIVGFLASAGHMLRFVMMHIGVGITSSSFAAALIISILSIPFARNKFTPAEIFAFPALLPMIPGMFAYKTILSIMQFLDTDYILIRQELMVDIVYNGLITFFIMCALAIGAMIPILALQRDSSISQWLNKLSKHKIKSHKKDEPNQHAND